jgi:DNA-binding NtrC family response regulator
LSEDALAVLEAHDFPGNVRELENRIQRALLVRSAELIHVADLDLGGRGAEPPPAAAADRAPDPLADAERQVIEQALVAAKGVVSQAAANLGLSRQALYRRMERLGIELERRPRA